MKKVLSLILAIIPTLMIAQTTVYFGNISSKTSIGLGFEKDSAIISLMETNKRKTFDNYQIDLLDMDGEPTTLNLKPDTTYDLKLDKTYAHQKDYKMDIRSYHELKRSLDLQSKLIINGNEYNGASIAGLLNSLETEQQLFIKGKLQNVRKISLWTWNDKTKPNIEMMRFRHLHSPNNFRYIRSRK